MKRVLFFSLLVAILLGYNGAVYGSYDKLYASALDTLQIKERQSTENESAHCKSVVYKTLESLPEVHADLLKNLTLYFTKTGRRGLGGGNTIILRCRSVSDQELSAVLIH